MSHPSAAIAERIVFDVETTLTEMSHAFDMKAGDVVYTGTPSGVAVGMGKRPPGLAIRLLRMLFHNQVFKFVFAEGQAFSKKPWLKTGDVVTAAAFLDPGAGGGALLAPGAFVGATRNEIAEARDWVWADAKALRDLGMGRVKSAAKEAAIIFGAVFALGFGLGAGLVAACCRGGSSRGKPKAD